ncbi:hypothetical protein HaLaN_23928 [Haematococcus lacustris]|uniref:Uncharacterized protein n=1 Tax=Haematococcus lacustris TaxID=44745 RepID=A0A6A0A1X0_HAELA|nr:hypothetical protein HaLaN_23928 [Haematococcus lacustris]
MNDAVLQLAGPAYTSQELPDGYVRRLEAACQLLHEGLRPPQATGAQTASSCPAAHNAPPAASPTPSAGSSIAAVELCTLLLTDQEVLDVVLALHDIRAAQLCHLLPWSGSHAVKLPPPSEALAKQLSQSHRSVPGSWLLAFVSALDHDSSLKGDPLLRVLDSMHRAMLLRLPPAQPAPGHWLSPALCGAAPGQGISPCPAVRHPAWAAAGAKHRNDGWSGASQSVGDELHALAVNSYGFLAQALWDVFGRQEEALAFKEFIATCQAEGGVAGWYAKRVRAYNVLAMGIAAGRKAHNELKICEPAQGVARQGWIWDLKRVLHARYITRK